MYPNVLSLDAPVVAVAWLYVFAKVWNVNYVEPLLPWVLGLFVWLVYAVDRLLDSSYGKAHYFPLRHQFLLQHKKYFIIGIGVVSVLTVVLALVHLQSSILQTALLPLAATVGYFILSTSPSASSKVSYSKNLLVGYAFSFGIGSGLIGLVGLAYPLNFLKLFSPEMLAFGLLCVISLTAIDLWVKGSDELGTEEDEWALTLPLFTLAAFCFLFMQFIEHNLSDPFYSSILVASGLMYVINRTRHRFSSDALRVAVDVVLLLAALFYFLLVDQ